jgi:DNA modification methylase
MSNSINKSKIVVLGRTFNSDEERRSYFREELRKKLPELKKMEGFPIGEDEDILNLSDAPYYTACPNPWLNDFIEEWENEKVELLKKGKRKSEFQVDVPYASDVSVGKNNPVYRAHSYHTKVPHPAIMRYVLHYTMPGDVVIDSFAGTGMTGVACQNLELPDPSTKFEIESEFRAQGLNQPIWGKRNCINSDLSPFASLISYDYNTPIETESFLEECNDIIQKLKDSCSNLYRTKHEKNLYGFINYGVWSDILVCPNCASDINYWDLAMSHEKKQILDEFTCPGCSSSLQKKDCENLFENYFDKINNTVSKIKKMIPVLYVYTCNGKRYFKRPDIEDLELIDKIKEIDPSGFIAKTRMPEGDESRRNDKYGITNVNHFFTYRNNILLSELNKLIEKSKYPKRTKFLLMDILGRANLMNRIHVKNYFFGGGGWNAGSMAGTLYIPTLPIETSIIELASDRISSLIRGYQSNQALLNNITQVASATNSKLNDNTVDYIFTDPPFGANIMYSELSFINESWLKIFTNNKQEAIENNTQGKSLPEYQNIMTNCFKEYYRVLKPGKWMTVEFSNTKAAVWNSIQTAIQNSGFVIANVTGLDKKQGGMRSITPSGVRQDLAISCYKPSTLFFEAFNANQFSDKAVWDFIDEHLQHLPIHLVKNNSTSAIIERSPKILFDRLISFYVQRGLPVPIDSGKFQHGLRDRFIERDGMFFTNIQAQEYDVKKAQVPNFTQLSIFVTNEQDSIYWLRNILEKDKKTESDLHPFWMKEVAGNMRKGDRLPEMRTILEENFLKDEYGYWYVPDTENEVDLEKLRNKRLLKQFEIYKIEATKPKTKIKEARVEALRAGFKQCYQDKDFISIVTIGDRIPNNLLMEDEVLLQFYDIASSRI